MGTHYGPERPESDFNPRPWFDDAPHYQSAGMDIRDVIEAFGLNFNLGYAVSRIVRQKPGNTKLMDLRKAVVHLQREIVALEREDHERMRGPERKVPRMELPGPIHSLGDNSFISRPPGGASGTSPYDAGTQLGRQPQGTP